MPESLSPRRTRPFVVLFVGLALALAAMATVLILRGWSDPEFQERMEQKREELGRD